MPTVNLGPVPGAESPVVVPGRVRLELARLVALAQDASVRLPFDVTAVEAALAVDPADGTGAAAADEARRAWYARLSSETPSPEDALAGLLAQQAGRAQAAADDPAPGPDAEAGRTAQREALTVLGQPEALLEVELGLRLGAGAPDQVRAWVAVRGQTAVSLGTVSGADFELAWGAVAALPEMLAHLVRLPATSPAEEGAEPVVPARFTLPVELMAAVEVGAQRHRDDLLPALVERFPRATTGADGEAYGAADTLGLLNAVHDGLTARLRVLVPGLQDDGTRLSGAGVVVWMRVGTQWFALDPDLVAGIPVARATAVEPRDLARWVGPVLARVRGKEGEVDG